MPNYVSKLIDENNTELLIRDSETSAGLAQEIEDRTTAETALSEQVADAVEDVQQLSNDIVGFDERISALEGQGKRYVILSDDYDYFDTTQQPPSPTWSSLMKSYLGVPTADFKVIQANGAGVSISLTNNWGALVLAQETDATVTEVIIAGGINDVNATEADINNGFGRIYTALNTVYPNARVTVAFIAASNDSLGTQEKLATVASYYQKACGGHVYKYIEGSETILYDRHAWLKSDHTTPNMLGIIALSTRLTQGYVSGSAYAIAPPDEINLGPDTDISYTEQNDKLTCSVYNGFYNVSLSFKLRIFVTNGMSYECDPDIPIKVGNINTGYLNGNHDGKSMVVVSCQVRDGSTWYNMQGQVSFKDGYMYIGLLSLTGSSYRTLSNLNYIIVEPFTASFPIVLN